MVDISFTGLFLHDTQMALLSLAQRRLAAAFSRHASESDLPFSFMLPFCPARSNIAEGSDKGAARARSRLTVGPAMTYSGWIVAPVTGSIEQGDGSPGKANGADEPETEKPDPPPTLPDYPELPRQSAFILGYAGPVADAVLADAVAAERQAKGSREPTVLTATLSARARYRARVTLTVARDGGSYSVTYAIGPASWER